MTTGRQGKTRSRHALLHVARAEILLIRPTSERTDRLGEDEIDFQQWQWNISIQFWVARQNVVDRSVGCLYYDKGWAAIMSPTNCVTTHSIMLGHTMPFRVTLRCTLCVRLGVCPYPCPHSLIPAFVCAAKEMIHNRVINMKKKEKRRKKNDGYRRRIMIIIIKEGLCVGTRDGIRADK